MNKTITMASFHLTGIITASMRRNEMNFSIKVSDSIASSKVCFNESTNYFPTFFQKRYFSVQCKKS